MAEFKGITGNRETNIRYDGTAVDLAGSLGVTSGSLVLAGSLAITNPSLSYLAGSLAVARDFIDMIFNRNTRPRVRVWLDTVEISNFIEGPVSVTFNDDSAAVFSFDLGGSAYNPFTNADIRSGKEVIIKSVYSDAAGTAFETPLFKGITKGIAFIGDSLDVRISGVDMSALVSRETDRLDMEIYSVDATTETVLADTVNQVTVSELISTEMDQPITGVWLESDTLRATNYFIGGSYTGKTITLGSPLPSIQNVMVAYFEGNLTVSTTPRLLKSAIVERIAGIAKIAGVVFPTRRDEDILSYKYIYANRELPLDIIKKIVTPQVWRVHFNELGELELWRSSVKSSPDWTLDDTLIDTGSLKVHFDDSAVINIQSVLGGIKEQQVLTIPGAPPEAAVFHPYSETLGERGVITSASLALSAAPDFKTSTLFTAGPLSNADAAINEEIIVSIPANVSNIGVSIDKSTGVYPDATQVSSSDVYLTRYWVRGSVRISQGKLKIRRLYSVAYGQFGTRYSMPPLDVAVTITGRHRLSTPAYTDPAVQAVPPEFDTSYYQVGSEMTDDTSINKYGLRPGKIFRGQFIETQQQCRRVAEEILKEANKVWTITLSIPLNPLVKRGQTLRVNSVINGIDITDVITDVVHTLDADTGAATTVISMRAAEYVFTSSLGENL